MNDSGLKVGDVVAGRYQIEGLIGAGGMGSVFAALDQRLGRKIALKALVQGARPTDAELVARRRLEAEARIIASLEHPAIVRLYDVIEDGASLLLVMELVSGTSLRERLDQGRLSFEETANIVGSVAQGLAAAHAQGLVHRDIKPENVMLRDDGRVALLDFGIAKVVGAQLDRYPVSTLTTPGAVIGTPMYLAPEQAEGTTVGPATDQFSLAVMAYELLTGDVPWRTESIAFLLVDILKADPPARAPIVGGGELHAVFLKALEKVPDKRFASVSAFSAALSSALGITPSSSTPSGRGANETPASPEPTSEARRQRSMAETQAPPAEATIAPSKLARTEPSSTPAKPASTDPTSSEVPSSERSVKAPETTEPSPRHENLETTTTPSRTRLRWIAFAGAIALGAVAMTARYWTWSTQTPADPSKAPSPSATAASSALIEDLPMSETKSASALQSYRSALKALRVGDINGNRRLLDDAIRDDPHFASALLQRAYLSLVLSQGHDEPGRAAFRAAVAEQSRLPERDQAFLDAMTPAFLDPPNWLAARTNLGAFVEAYPNDEEAWLAIAAFEFKRGSRPDLDSSSSNARGRSEEWTRAPLPRTARCSIGRSRGRTSGSRSVHSSHPRVRHLPVELCHLRDQPR